MTRQREPGWYWVRLWDTNAYGVKLLDNWRPLEWLGEERRKFGLESHWWYEGQGGDSLKDEHLAQIGPRIPNPTAE